MIENKEQQASELRDAIKITSEIWCQLIKLWKKIYAVGGSAVAFAWFVWEKGYRGETTIGWLN